ncbi:hypothetical protein C7999DRAFT_43737 [Corynascus novoguineensis]|uniref:Uncharacterized protein n=1 Tax=Corynascus novoguineensis TaxID=1126955 RepID=A0AAN7CM14_9PEZI|nr:hypothetical protein C7999DRAFT_43737 [Corynascus novoguineensis]
MSANPNSVVHQDQFHSRVPPAKPMMTSGHQPGRQVGKDAVPEFRAETHAPGTAPKEHSYKPNPIHETPGQALNPDAWQAESGGRTEPLDMPGATSADIYRESTFSRPMEGQYAREIHGAHGVGKRKKERNGLEGVGACTLEETVEGRARQIASEERRELREKKGR